MFCGFVYFRGWTISPKVRNPGVFYLAWRKGNNEENTTSWIWGNGQAMMVRPLVSPTAWEPDGAGVILLWTKWICRRAEVASTYTICAQPMASWDPQTRKAYEKSHLKNWIDTKSALQSCQRQRSWNAFHCFVETIFKRNNFHFQFHQSSIWGQCESLWCPGCSDVCWQQFDLPSSTCHYYMTTIIYIYMSLSFEFDSCIEVEERLCGWNLQAFTFAYLHRIDANRDVCVWISESYRHSGRWI